MCNFFSLCTDGKGKRLYFNAEQRKKLKDEQSDYEPDSHTSIADFYGYKGKREDVLNKYEYNPLTKKFTVDQLNTNDDIEAVVRWCQKLDFKTIVPELIIKPIINPFTDRKAVRATKADLKLLKEWYSVRDSVEDSVWNSVEDSVGNSVWNLVRDSVEDSVWNSVEDSVGNSVRDSVWHSVEETVGDSVGYSVGVAARYSVWYLVKAYILSFFDIKYDYDFSSVMKLWEKGLVPSYNGKTWRLHGKDGNIIWTEGIK